MFKFWFKQYFILFFLFGLYVLFGGKEIKDPPLGEKIKKLFFYQCCFLPGGLIGGLKGGAHGCFKGEPIWGTLLICFPTGGFFKNFWGKKTHWGGKGFLWERSFSKTKRFKKMFKKKKKTNKDKFYFF